MIDAAISAFYRVPHWSLFLACMVEPFMVIGPVAGYALQKANLGLSCLQAELTVEQSKDGRLF